MDTLHALPAELTIYTVGEWHPRCLQWLRATADAGQTPADDELGVAADAVIEIDAAGLQLLLSLSNALARQQRALKLIQPSQALAQACLSLGIPLLGPQPTTPEAAP